MNKVFLSLQSCMGSILECKGGNKYKMKHDKKDQLIAANLLPTMMSVEEKFVKDAAIAVGHPFATMFQSLDLVAIE